MKGYRKNNALQRLKEEHRQDLADLRLMPRGWNPLRYIFWLIKVDFKKVVILFLLIFAVAVIASSTVVYRNKYFEIEKQKIQLEKLLKSKNIKFSFEKGE